MNLLTTPLPYAVKVGGREVPINTSFRVGMRFELLALDDQLTPENVLTTFFGDNWPQPYDEAVKQALWFYCLGEPHEKEETDKQNLKPSRRSYDFEIDADALYTSFREAYGVDLLQEDLHWWAFRELMLGLPDDTPFKQRVYIVAVVGAFTVFNTEHKRRLGDIGGYNIGGGAKLQHKVGVIGRKAAVKPSVIRHYGIGYNDRILSAYKPRCLHSKVYLLFRAKVACVNCVGCYTLAFPVPCNGYNILR